MRAANFFRAQFQHGLAVGLLQVTKLLFVFLPNIERVCPQRILHTPTGVIGLALDLGWGKVIAASGFRHCCLTLNDLDDQR